MFKIYTVYDGGVSGAPFITDDEHTANLYWSVVRQEFRTYPRHIVAAYYYNGETLRYFIEE